MAVAVGLRLVVLIALGVHRAVLRSQTPSVASWDSTIRYFRDRLLDPGESDAALSADMSAYDGSVVQVTTFSGDFEVRRVQVNWSVGTAAMLDEDVRVCTFHLIKAPGGTPSSDWQAADFNAARDALLAYWTTMKVYYLPSTKLVSIKFYRAGPAIVPPQPPVFSHEPTPVAGTSAASVQMPPQLAVSITEKTAIRRSWGRWYLPAMMGESVFSPEGRIPDAMCNAFADAADTLYEAFRTANLPAVVYRRPLPEREEADGDTLPARAASALTVDALQVDNLYDVIRSRRYDKPSLRVQRAVG